MNRAIEVTIQGTVATAPVLTRQEGKKPYCLAAGLTTTPYGLPPRLGET